MINKFFPLILIIFSIFKDCESIDCGGNASANVETNLRSTLFCNYDKSQRPVFDAKKPVNIRLRYIVRSFEYTDNDETLTIDSWMSMRWYDEHLAWDPTNFKGIDVISESSDVLWMPDLYLYNSDISSGMGECHQAECMIFSNGKINCIIPCTHTGHCDGEFKNWPFDRQNCTFRFGSWMKTGAEMNYNAIKSTVKSEESAKHSQWKMIATFFRKLPGAYGRKYKNKTYPQLEYSFLLERHNAFHVASIFVPAFVLMGVNLLLCWMSPDGYERFTLATINLFSHYIYLEQMFFYVPYNGDTVPTVLLFFRDSMFITAFSLCLTVIFKMINNYDEKPAQWIESFATIFTSKLGFGNLFFSVKTMSGVEDSESLLVGKSSSSHSKDNFIWRTFVNILDKLLFLVLVIVYFVMVINLLPKGYEDNSWEAVAVENFS